MINKLITAEFKMFALGFCHWKITDIIDTGGITLNLVDDFIDHNLRFKTFTV